MKMGNVFWKRFFVGFAFFMYFGIAAFPAFSYSVLNQGWNDLGVDRTSITVSRLNQPGVAVNFNLSGFSNKRIILDSEEWQSITFPEQGICEVVGAPALPLMRRFIAVPPNATVNVEIMDVEFKTFENVKVEPHQRLLYEHETVHDRVFALNQELYNTNQLYPANWASADEKIVMAGVHMQILQINPIRYNPVTGTMQAASKISCKITFNDYTEGINYSYPSRLQKSLKGLALNYDFMNYKMRPTRARMSYSEDTDYLIICDPKLKETASLNNFVNYYKSEGYVVEVKDASDLSSSTAIKDYIQSVYDKGELDYVLLVGHLSAIPYHSANKTKSDSYYSFLDGNDKVGDVGLGRMPAKDETNLNYMVTKTLNFQTGAEPGEWRKKVSLIAHKENYPNKYTKCMEQVYNHEYKLIPPKFDRIYGGDGGTNAMVNDAWNEGRLVMNYRGHGSQTAWTGWGDGSYSVSLVDNLSNGKKTPMVWNMACNNGEISTSKKCLSEAQMCQEQGAVACNGATAPSMTAVNHVTNKGIFWATWDKGIETVGDIRIDADAYSIQESGSNANKNIQMYIFFGDPLINLVKVGNVKYIGASSPDSADEVEKKFVWNITWSDNIKGKVKIDLLKGGKPNKTIASSVESNGLFEWKVPGNLKLGTDYKIRITSLDSTDLFGETRGTFSIINEYIVNKFPHMENIDDLEKTSFDLPKKWEQSSDDDLQWTVWNGMTPTKHPDQGAATGPDADNSGNGNYLYVESSGSNNPSKKATFSTTKYDLSYLNDAKLSFYYHMFSDNEGKDEMGDLYLDISVDGVWKNDVLHLSKNKGDKWHLQEVPLDAYKGERVVFRFRAVTGSGWASDICLDDIQVTGNPTSINNVSTVLPQAFDLNFNGSRINFAVPDNGNNSHISLKLYNPQGKMIRTLVNGNIKAGYHSMALGKHGNSEQRLAVGMYVCRMVIKDFTKTIKFLYR